MESRYKRKGRTAQTVIEAGFDPFEYLLKEARTATSKARRDRLALELLPYVRPKLRSVEMTATVNTIIRYSVGDGAPDTRPDPGMLPLVPQLPPLLQ
jgi:hypothetical protein